MRRFRTPRPLVEVEILPVKFETPSEEDPEELPEEVPAENPNEDPDEDPEENPEESPEEDPDEDPEENPEESPEEDPDEDPEEIPEKETEEESGETVKKDCKGKREESPSKESCSKRICKRVATPVDPALESDAESEYRPMNVLQWRGRSPDNSVGSQESRVGPERRGAYFSPIIHYDSPCIATCSWKK